MALVEMDAEDQAWRSYMANVGWLVATRQYVKSEAFPKWTTITEHHKARPKDQRTARDVMDSISARLARYGGGKTS